MADHEDPALMFAFHQDTLQVRKTPTPQPAGTELRHVAASLVTDLYGPDMLGTFFVFNAVTLEVVVHMRSAARTAG